ncbi:FAD:protein FMN transferase [Pelagibius sp. Alg239-R121]|uniref:FAD:protein FMN transferase n=1 Tax=Pelagibius sp. Alg239-R121 TaxID=2993448 RepID=UPI0024A75925|nr:FAD:protein FMN transferase [Pelagibius sp. Alg239-R121]
MKPKLSRRRFLSISAAAVALPPSALAEIPTAKWRGTALGAKASMTLAGLEAAAAQDIFSAVQSEVARLESIFSLYQEESALVRLNRTGVLEAPPAELLEVLSQSDTLYRVTERAFDPTVQPLWHLYAQRAAEGKKPSQKELSQVQQRTGWARLRYSAKSISFERAGMGLTFNGIAQGYIADKVAALLRAQGLRQVLIDMGEIAAVGRHPDGRPWQVGIAAPGNEVLRQLPLEDRALATSAPRGTLLDRKGRVGHILDPRNGQIADSWNLVSVSAERAAIADGLSTACCLLSRASIERVLATQPGAKLEALV